MDREIEKFLKKNDGVASVSEVADLLELDEGQVRKWARENSVRRIGSTFVFGRETTSALVDDLLPEDDGDEDSDEPGDEVDDEDEDGADEDRDELEDGDDDDDGEPEDDDEPE